MRPLMRLIGWSANPFIGQTCHMATSTLLSIKPYPSYPCPPVNLPPPQPNWEYLTDPANLEAIRQNIKLRKSPADIDLVQNLYKEIYLNRCIHQVKSDEGRAKTEENLLAAALSVPNTTPDSIIALGEENETVDEIPFSPPPFKLRSFDSLGRILSGARLTNMGVISGERSYYLVGPLAQLEQALIHWTVDSLVKEGFSLVSVPDILHPDIIQACGMMVEGNRTQVYRLGSGYGSPAPALSGTAEMALGGGLANRCFKESSLPLKLCAVSRCYRAETGGGGAKEGGLYRVTSFTKVEMFVVTSGDISASSGALEDILSVQRRLFSSLGLSYRVLSMCPWELGDPAHTKYDIEALMPARVWQPWGEVSSCSNCTDYQARRLGITSGPEGHFVHTCNGTACAVPRMLIALLEQRQTPYGGVSLPPVLRPYMDHKEVIEPKPRKQRPHFTWMPGAKFLDKKLPLK